MAKPAMVQKTSRQRIYAALLALGAGILLMRTLRMMLVEGAFELLVWWVITLLIIEFLIDLACLAGSIRWFISSDRNKAGLALWAGALATIMHAIRVLVYVLGRTGPWVNFDVKPEHRATYTFEWFWVWFAGILAIAGIIGVVVIWLIIRHKKKR